MTSYTVVPVLGLRQHAWVPEQLREHHQLGRGQGQPCKVRVDKNGPPHDVR